MARKKKEAEQTEGTSLIGRGWTDTAGNRFKVVLVSPDLGNRCEVLKEGEQSTFSMPLDEVQAAFAVAAEIHEPGDAQVDDVTETVELIGCRCVVCAKYMQAPPHTAKPRCDECVSAGLEPVDESLGPDLGEMRGLNPDRAKKKVLTLEGLENGKVIDEINAQLVKLQGLIGARGGKGAVTFKLTMKPGEGLQEFALTYEVGLTPPKVKGAGEFFEGTDILPGVKKRDDDRQTTIADAQEQAETVFGKDNPEGLQLDADDLRDMNTPDETGPDPDDPDGAGDPDDDTPPFAAEADSEVAA